MPPNNTTPQPLTAGKRQQIENKYWLEFMAWYAEGNEWKHWDGHTHAEYPLDMQFWKWIATVKVKEFGAGKIWEQL